MPSQNIKDKDFMKYIFNVIQSSDLNEVISVLDENIENLKLYNICTSGIKEGLFSINEKMTVLGFFTNLSTIVVKQQKKRNPIFKYVVENYLETLAGNYSKDILNEIKTSGLRGRGGAGAA